MDIRPPSDIRRHNALVLVLKRAIESTFNESDWKELGYKTATQEWISNHPRLLRSLNWGDSDYGSHVFDAIEFMLETDPANLQVLMDSPSIRDWIRENEPFIYSEFFGETSRVIERIEEARKSADGFDIDTYIKRIKESLPYDPALAVGSTKELIESVLKTILGIYGAESSDEDMPKLLKRAQAALGIDPKDIDLSIPGSEPLRRLLGSLAQIVIAVTELRNLYGTGHGKSNAPGLDPASTNLVVGAGITAATYLMERYRKLKGKR